MKQECGGTEAIHPVEIAKQHEMHRHSGQLPGMHVMSQSQYPLSELSLQQIRTPLL